MTQNNLAFPFHRHALALALALATSASNAATINVTGACTLVNAINNANADADTDGPGGCPAGSGADVLNLKANSIYTLTKVDTGDEFGANGLPSVSSVITINGNGAIIKRSERDGTPEFRLLSISSYGDLTVNKLNLKGGALSERISGSSISNQGYLTLNKITVSGSSGRSSIVNDGSLSLNNSTVSNNGAIGGEVCIQNFYSNMSLNNSTISDNHGLGIFTFKGNTTLINTTVSDNSGGGVDNDTANITLTNSTVSGNGRAGVSGYRSDMVLINSTVSNNNGAGISFSDSIQGGAVTLTNTTVSGNSADGISFNFNSNYYSADMTLTNSTVAGNGGRGISLTSTYNNGFMTLTNSLISSNTGADCYLSSPDISTLQGVNFIGDGGCGAPLSGDPLLSALLDNGGITLTKALQTGSPAINAADSTLCPKTDQRNVKRPPPKFNACDIGAFKRTKGIPASVTGIVQFFDLQVASGGVTGTGSGDLAPQQLDALRNQLLTAGHYKQQHLPLQACAQLARTAERIDPDNTQDADDYVTGDQAQTLADKVALLRLDWLCK